MSRVSSTKSHMYSVRVPNDLHERIEALFSLLLRRDNRSGPTISSRSQLITWCVENGLRKLERAQKRQG